MGVVNAMFLSVDNARTTNTRAMMRRGHGEETTHTDARLTMKMGVCHFIIILPRLLSPSDRSDDASDFGTGPSVKDVGGIKSTCARMTSVEHDDVVQRVSVREKLRMHVM